MFHSNSYPSNRQLGFTLIEMLIVVSIIAVIASLAYPSMQRQIANARMIQAAGDLESALKTARANALIQKRDVNTVVNTTNKTIQVVGTDGIQLTYSKNIAITSTAPNLTTTFTTRKTANEGRYEICYSGVSLQRIIVNVDTRSNITVNKNGGACS